MGLREYCYQLDAPAGSGLGAVIDVSLAHPLRLRHRMDPEIDGDLLDRHPVLTVCS
jgi:hypothetical protein